MRKKGLLICLTVCSLLLLGGCQKNGDSQPVLKSVEYSNLSSADDRRLLTELMEQSQIAKERQKLFLSHVSDFNDTVSPKELTTGFEQRKIGDLKYDPYVMQDEWTAAHPDFMGYNCRITAWELYSDFLQVPADEKSDDEMILMDISSLEADPSAMLKAGDEKKFRVFYSTVPTEATSDIAVHVKNLQQNLSDRGISFQKNSKASLISVWFHDNLDEKDNLFIGHVGVLFPEKNGQLYFVEKLAFQEPYQLTKFKNRVELNDYLMTKYDVDENQTTAAPFIMENDQLLDGYRSVRGDNAK